MNLLLEIKRTIRAEVESQRNNLIPEHVAEKGTAVVSQLENLPLLKTAQFVHSYVSRGNEVKTHSFIRKQLTRGTRVAVPKVVLPERILRHYEIRQFSQLSPGTFGILEPDTEVCEEVQPGELDLIIVPGIAFDLNGHRVGFGGGYYDSFLGKVKGIKIGLAYSFQIVGEIPTHAGDQRVDMIITEKTIHTVKDP